MITVVNKYKHKPTAFDYYAGRPSLLGNPFHIGWHGDRDTVIRFYDQWLCTQLALAGSVVDQEMTRLIHRYRRDEQLNLVCFCAPQSCHAEVIKRELLKRLPKEVST